jgi:hypothetical protein
MAFRTKLDFSSNRQVKQRIETFTHLSGGTIFGLPFSSLPTGPDLRYTGITFSSSTVLSTFSGNSANTVYSWYYPQMSAASSTLLPITPAITGITQEAVGFFPISYTTIDGNTVATAYSGISFDLIISTITDLGGGNYAGSVQSEEVLFLSAGTLDFTGRTIWNDVSGITRTEDFIMTRTPIVGAMLECIDSEGKGSWIPASASTSGLWIAGTGLNSVRLNGGGNTASGVSSVAEGYNTTASGGGSHSEGLDTTASGSNGSHAEGNNTTASGSSSHAEGYYTIAGGAFGAHAEGNGSHAIGSASHAEGISTQATGVSSHAEGASTMASGNNSHAEGASTYATGENSHAEGSSTLASGATSHAEGQNTIALGTSSHAEGNDTIALGSSSHAEGSITRAGYYLATATYISGGTNNSRFALSQTHGNVSALFQPSDALFIDDSQSNNNFNISLNNTIYSSVFTNFGAYSATVVTLSGLKTYPDDTGTIYITPLNNQILLPFPNSLLTLYGHSEGWQTKSFSFNCHAEGSNSVAGASTSHAEGAGTLTSGYASHAEGNNTIASGSESHAEGLLSKASGSGSHAEGYDTIASGDYSHAEGYDTLASGNHSHAEGYLSIASNYGAHAEGGSSFSAIKGGTATGIGSHAEGLVTSATTNGAHAEGNTTLASGGASHAEGSNTIASGYGSHAQGYRSLASGECSHAEGGYLTGLITGGTASGYASHAEGLGTLASGIASHAQGSGTTASGLASHAEGFGTISSNDASHAEGIRTVSTMWGCHAEGWQTSATTATGCHAEGINTLASNSGAHAQGQNTRATGNSSHAQGQACIADGTNSFAGGNNSSTYAGDSMVFGTNSMILSGATYSIVLGRSITGTTQDTTYVDRFNVKTVGSTAFLNDIRIDANGNLTTNTSDERLKENITPLSGALATIQGLQGVSYQWKDRNAGTDAVKLGFIAQQVDTVDSRLAFTNPVDGYMGLHIDGIIPLLVEAVKELASGGTSNEYLQTQTILAEDNNIELNYSGTPTTALGGGLTVLHGMGIDLSSELIVDANGNWTTNNDFIPNKITLPAYTPSGSTDTNGNLGNVTRDDDYLYIRTNTGWKRTNLENF